MKYKMVVADFDGTLGKAPDIIEDYTLQAIKEYTERGGKFVVCTGRELSSIRPIMLKHGIKGDVIACQGAIIADVESGKKKFFGGLERRLAAEIIDYLSGIPEIDSVMVIYDDGLRINKSTAFTSRYEKLTSLTADLQPKLSEYIFTKELKVQKVMALCEPENIDGIISRIAKRFTEITVNSGAAGLIEMINPECSKGVTTLRLSESYGFAPGEVMTVGDSTNDLTLMGFGFHGVAVGDGAKELKNAAAEVTVPYPENPVGYLIRKYCI